MLLLILVNQKLQNVLIFLQFAKYIFKKRFYFVIIILFIGVFFQWVSKAMLDSILLVPILD
jgi:hypothetical protein